MATHYSPGRTADRDAEFAEENAGHCGKGWNGTSKMRLLVRFMGFSAAGTIVPGRLPRRG
jgi:hypothetical protein